MTTIYTSEPLLDSNDLPLRRRTLYPAEVRGHLLNFRNPGTVRHPLFAQRRVTHRILRRRSLYPAELRKRMKRIFGFSVRKIPRIQKLSDEIPFRRSFFASPDLLSFRHDFKNSPAAVRYPALSAPMRGSYGFASRSDTTYIISQPPSGVNPLPCRNGKNRIPCPPL